MTPTTMTDVKIPRWVRWAERGELRLTADLEKAYRRSDLVLLLWSLFFGVGAIAILVQAWMHAHHETRGQVSGVLFIPGGCVMILASLIGSDERWIAAVVLRSRAPGGVGLRWVAQQAPVLRWHRVRRWPIPVLVILFFAIWPVTHQIDPHPTSTRFEIELCEQAALFFCFALVMATVLRRVNRRCFRATRDALLAAEADQAQEPAAGATTAG